MGYDWINLHCTDSQFSSQDGEESFPVVGREYFAPSAGSKFQDNGFTRTSTIVNTRLHSRQYIAKCCTICITPRCQVLHVMCPGNVGMVWLALAKS